MKCIPAAIAALLLTGSVASAQTVSPSWRWDTAVVTAFYFGRPTDLPQTQHHDEWFSTGQFGITGGRYLTPHLKAEAEVSLTGTGHRYASQIVEVVGGRPTVVGVEQHISTRALSGTLAWQFFDNEWVHPYVMAGVGFDFDHTRVETFSPFVIDNTSETTELRVRGIVGAGLKAYFTPRGFVRTEVRSGLGDRGSHLALRAGIGFDF